MNGKISNTNKRIEVVYQLQSIRHMNHPYQQINEQWPLHLPHPETQ